MDVRFSTDPNGFRRMTTEELRKSFLIDQLFVPDEIPMVYSDIDRSITGSAVPVKGALKLLGTKKEMAAEYFAERREIGVINTGSAGSVRIDGKEYADHHPGMKAREARSAAKPHNKLAARTDHSEAKRTRTARSSKLGTT